MHAIAVGDSAEDVIQLARRTGHSRFPVYDDDLDDITGVVHVKAAVSVPREKRGEVPVGVMIEVPAAALALPAFIRDVDFLSVGTNDLVQYLLAVDRNHEGLGRLYTPLHPAVIRVLRDTIRLAQRHSTPISVCGEMAAAPDYASLLLALGLTDFSLHPGTMLEVRRRIRECDHAALQARLPALLRARDRESIERWLATATD